MAVRYPRITAARRQKALEQAEKEFAKSDKKRGKRKYVSLRTREIKERLELFQPREFNYGTRSVSPDWVRELARRISIHGELDPVLVIRIGKQWVCVDGHHRIAAYRLKNHKKSIKCQWFPGAPTEAVDESMRRNKKDTLPISLADRCEEAWRRVLLNKGSKKQISHDCGVSLGTIANMRRVKRRYETDPEFAGHVGRPLMETSWGLMLLAGGNREQHDTPVEAQAAQLARTIRRRCSDLLSKDPVVTAHALAMYDYRLPKALNEVWEKGRVASPGARNLTEPEMRKQAQVLRERADAIDATLAKWEARREEALEDAAWRRQEEQTRQNELWRQPAFDIDPDGDEIQL